MKIKLLYQDQLLAAKTKTDQETQTSTILQKEFQKRMHEENVSLNAQIKLMEARLQTLTEDKDLMTIELKENNHWVDNQHALHKANKELFDKVSALSKEKIELEDKISLLQSKFERL